MTKYETTISLEEYQPQTQSHIQGWCSFIYRSILDGSASQFPHILDMNLNSALNPFYKNYPASVYIWDKFCVSTSIPGFDTAR